jgi:hypothetical protein
MRPTAIPGNPGVAVSIWVNNPFTPGGLYEPGF